MTSQHPARGAAGAKGSGGLRIRWDRVVVLAGITVLATGFWWTVLRLLGVSAPASLVVAALIVVPSVPLVAVSMWGDR